MQVNSKFQITNKFAYSHICLFICLFAYSHICLFPALAQSPTPEEIPTPQVTQVDDEKIREIRDQVREKIQEKIQEIKEKGKLRGYVGEILNIEGLEIILETRRGERQITIDEEAEIIGPKRQSFELEDFEVGDMIICMGNVDTEDLTAESTDKMIAKRIVVIPQPPKPPNPRWAVFGKVTEIDEDSLILSLIHPRKENLTYEIKVTKDTKVTKKLDDEMQKVGFDNIAIDDRLITIGTWDEEEILTAKLIHVIPSKSNSEL